MSTLRAAFALLITLATGVDSYALLNDAGKVRWRTRHDLRRPHLRSSAPPKFHHPSSRIAQHLSNSHDNNSQQSLIDDALNKLQRQFQGKPVHYVQRHLVQLGARHYRALKPKDEEEGLVRVNGCVANVYLQTHLSGEQYASIRGTADALVARGMLVVLAQVLQGHDAASILNLDATHLADRLGLRAALSEGRNDGLAQMLRVVQSQIRQQLAGSAKEETAGLMPSVVETNAPNSHNTNKPTVALLLSGGVDSSVALRLLQRQGYQVTAFYLRIWLEDELAHLGHCPWEDDYRVCEQVCAQAGVPIESISLQAAYKERVISYTIKEAQSGRTPNPDIMCNSRIKFGCFYDAIQDRGFDFVATGHYARLEWDEATHRMRLFRAPDPVKDQSYFLCALTQEQLQNVIFPLGTLVKTRVRELAEEFELPNRHRPDSQGLCFLGKVKFDEFLEAYLGERPGPIIDAATGDVLGQHRGIWYHTVGQRKGIGKVLDPLATSRGPWYVVAKDPEHNTVFCSNQYDAESFEAPRSKIAVEDIHWIGGSPPDDLVVTQKGRFTMKLRHGPRLVEGNLTLTDGAGHGGDIHLDQKDSGLAPGQFVVLYRGEECLGGGVISEKHWARFLLDREALDAASSDTLDAR